MIWLEDWKIQFVVVLDFFFSYKTAHISSQKYYLYKELQASLPPCFLIPIQFMDEAMSHKWNRICTRQQSLSEYLMMAALFKKLPHI